MTRTELPRRLVWTWLTILALGGCATLPLPAAPTRGLPPPSREVLSNGLRLIIQEHRAADVVALQLWVGVGARDESPAERGFSHFVEHMLFKGTPTLGRGFVDQEVEGVGGRTNAGTSYDYTFYYMLLPVTRAMRGIEVLADMAFNAAFDPEEMVREREVVFEEVRLADDNVRTFLNRRLHELMFEGHPYGFPVLGDPAALRAADQTALRGYYRRHYVPENMAVVVVGPVSPPEVRAAVARAFGVTARSVRDRVMAPAAPPLDGGRQRVVQRPERQASLGLGWTAPALGHPDMFAMDVLSHILGGSRSSRLNQALRERARLVTSIGAAYSAQQRGGALTITAQFEPADARRVEAAILEEVRRVQEQGVTPEELARAVTASESAHEFGRETVEGLARAYGRAETVWTLEAELRYLDGIRSLTREAVREAARRYLAAPHVRLALEPGGRGR
ncbi:MAG TPA: pitrilysin family protein [Methylomirabilota bacterium]|jgi:zinc protease|nr:pitrilysin family protein [Methylomirabilota bacterium]